MISLDRPPVVRRLASWVAGSRWLVWGAMAVVALEVAVAVWHVETDTPARSARVLESSTRPLRTDAAPPDLVARVAATGARDGERSIGLIEEALYGHGSLRQTTPDGGWTADGPGLLLPDIGLRRRFDQLLTTLGEATADELGRLLRTQAARELAPAAVDQVMAIWQAYLALQRQVFRHEADPADPRTWQAALDERVQARRAALGPAWASAFYRSEEAAVQAHIGSHLDRTEPRVMLSDMPATTLPEAARRPAPEDDAVALQRRRVEEFGVDAAQRLADEDAAQSRWDQRLAEARQRIAGWQQAPELSSAQRTEAVERYLRSAFDPSERLRLRAVSRLDPPG